MSRNASAQAVSLSEHQTDLIYLLVLEQIKQACVLTKQLADHEKEAQG